MSSDKSADRDDSGPEKLDPALMRYSASEPFTLGGPDPCPDDASSLCWEFVIDSAMEWRTWAWRAHNRFRDCSKKYDCIGSQPDVPDEVRLHDCDSVKDCKKVCRDFRKWAKKFRKWALEFTKAVDGWGDCLTEWTPTVGVPNVPTGPCGDCTEVCKEIRSWHKQMCAWAEHVRYPLNELCTIGTTTKVPPPPPPPGG